MLVQLAIPIIFNRSLQLIIKTPPPPPNVSNYKINK